MRFSALTGMCLLALWAGGCSSVSVRGPVQLDGRTYVLPPAHVGQKFGAGVAAKAEPEVAYQSEDGMHTVTARPFVRFDSVDQARTHLDLRQADYVLTLGGLELAGGVGLFHWGVLEGSRLNDVVNQLDFVEDVDQKQKLGQPYTKIKYTLSSDFLVGRSFSIEAEYLPVSRPRTFPGSAGRLRPPTAIDDTPQFESPLGQWHPSFALRGTYAGPYLNVGVTAFSGHSRDPRFVAQLTSPEVVAAYDLMQQVGTDVSLALGDLLFKAEAVGRLYGKRLIPSFAVGAGVEYTWFEPFTLPCDVTFLGEYTFDHRPLKTPKTITQNDLFGGVRLALNDDAGTTFTGGGLVDLSTVTDLGKYSGVLRLSAERRLSDNWKVLGDIHVFAASHKAIEWWLARDTYGQASIAYYF